MPDPLDQSFPSAAVTEDRLSSDAVFSESASPSAASPEAGALDANERAPHSMNEVERAHDAENKQLHDVDAAEAVDATSSGSTPPRSSGDFGRLFGLPPSGTSFPDQMRPSYLFLGVVAAISLFADISTKVWAEIVINRRGFEPINIIGDNFNITLAYNQGGAWGLFASADKMVRLPFFLAVSTFAIFFIVSLYSRLSPSQKALKWGLPMVLGGALGNLSDRITRSQVIDFIDYRADWVMRANSFVAKYVKNWAVTDHWPTFNVADIAICIGVGLMGVDMITHRHRPQRGPDSNGPSHPTDPKDASQQGDAAHTTADSAPATI